MDVKALEQQGEQQRRVASPYGRARRARRVTE
ncbi:hypothetical protein Ae406Ps2_3025c [Pseudonocardia sp. Ae406_Ps2]|nr:hypothetical protein Ae331Ps2_2904 [Pseudonocardia sp. Ae331_Ps2]OLM03025.1 hypothetical protein Ae406Ps2_3025c [Pseudonocardia sp. Ae406_Ps2]OLM12123.1 hypothetical protein Ae505Ps2_2250 [Pseudonocardia sp. Ae505_Ps2]